ncbi:MFS transporter [Candidatus Sumerlaeota bacterium]|nr:MFS transporter [Candidatus Sumerlaeota bacterium]
MENNPTTTTMEQGRTVKEKYLFWACFISLIATAFGFIVRTQVIDEWGVEFGLSETQKGEILGVGLWPFAISIVLFSLIIDKIGYGRAMVFAFVCHVVSAILTIFANNYEMLYLGTFIVALGNGTVEAVINPVVITMFSKQKVKWLNILHAAWPGGLVLGGIIALAMGEIGWKWKVGLILIPTAVYGVMMLGQKFPVHERVAAGISYKDMLKEVGILGALIIVVLMVSEVGRVFLWTMPIQVMVMVVLVGSFGAYVRSLGRPLFIILLLIMLPLATTELGTDSWITELLTPEMEELGFHAGWVLVYTSFIMMVLRFFAGPIVKRIAPLGLLAASSAIAAIGLVSLSASAGALIFAAATLYGIGKSFFWPTMLGVVSEQFPRGGALTINTIAGVGMLGVGIVGSVFLGNIQDRKIDSVLLERNPALHAQLVEEEEKSSVFGRYSALDTNKLEAADEDSKEIVNSITADAKKSALATTAIFPVIMLISYLGLIFYFKSKGGYKPLDLQAAAEQTQ